MPGIVGKKLPQMLIARLLVMLRKRLPRRALCQLLRPVGLVVITNFLLLDRPS